MGVPQGTGDGEMFGMNDPVSVLNQLRSYAAEGRLEMAEVMAEELSATLARKKDGNLPIQEMLVEAL